MDVVELGCCEEGQVEGEEACVGEVGDEWCAEEDEDDVDEGRGEEEGEDEGEDGGLLVVSWVFWDL